MVEVAGGRPFQSGPGGQADQFGAEEVGVVEPDGIAGKVVAGDGDRLDNDIQVLGEDGVEEFVLAAVVLSVMASERTGRVSSSRARRQWSMSQP